MNLGCLHVLKIHSDLSGNSFTEPEVRGSDLKVYASVPCELRSMHPTNLKCVLLLRWRCIHWCRILSHLAQSLYGVVYPTRAAPVAWARRVLDGIDEAANDAPGCCFRRHGRW